MAPSTTSYNTLTVDYDDFEEDREATSTRKITSVATVLCAVVVMFFAGRVYEGQASPYTHSEVMDISAKCGEGEFIGGCVGCKDCAPYEFENGGCSFFKDTFCSYCEPIKNCNRENIECETREDQICIKCNCADQVGNWTDIELGHFLDYEMFDRPEFAETSQDAATYSCYYDEQCVPCTVCPLGYFQTSACEQGDGGMLGITVEGIHWHPNPYPSGGSGDTECQKCLDCTEDQWVSKKCTYFENTECTDCTHFTGAIMDEWTSTKCYRFESTGPLYEGADALPTTCHKTAEAQWYTEPCVEFADSESTDCYMCLSDRTCDSMGGEYIRDHCVEGTTAEPGATTVCNKCSNADEFPGFYESTKCDPLDTHDAGWTECKICKEGEYEHTGCHLYTDTICPPCFPINHCAPEHTICSEGRYEVEETGRTGENNRPGNNSECVGVAARAAVAPSFACDENYFGIKCDYLKTFGDCGVGAGYRERTAKTGKFKGATNDEFVAWCMMLCSEFPDCTAVEIDDGGGGENWTTSGDNKLFKPNSLCSMKNKHTGTVEIMSNTKKDCYSNLNRQQENAIHAEMAKTNAVVDHAPRYFKGVACVDEVCSASGSQSGSDEWITEDPLVSQNPAVIEMLERERKVEMGSDDICSYSDSGTVALMTDAR